MPKPAPSPKRRRRSAPPLDLGNGFGFPFRQEVRVPSSLSGKAEALARSVLDAAGFDPASVSGADAARDQAGTTGFQFWIGERGLRRRSVTSSTAVIPIIAVFVCGSILGGLDAYIVGSPVVGVFWVLGAAGASLIFWLRFGGTYDSDLVMVTVAPPPAPSSPEVPVVFWAARVRSQIHSDVREPAVVSGPLKLAAELGSLVHEFERRATTPPRGPVRNGAPVAA